MIGLLGLIHATAIPVPSPTPQPLPGAGLVTQSFLLSLLIWGPVAMALALAIFPNPRGRNDVLFKQIAFFTNLMLLFVAYIGYNQFTLQLGTVPYEENREWLPGIGAAYHLGVAGPEMAMLMLSGLIGIVAVLASLGIRERVRSYFVLLLLTQGAVNGVIVAHDLFVLLLFWAAPTVPLALMVLGWGGPRREAAAWKLLAYWGVGTAALAVAVVILYAATGGSSFDSDTVLKATLSPRIQLAVGVALIVAAATRLPLFPLHGWARDVYADAPVGVGVVIAGSASRLGGFLLLRLLVGAEHDAANLLAPFVAAIGALTVAYAGVVALRATDLRVVAAHLALAPAGVTLLGLASLTPLAIVGSVLSLFAGGLAAAFIVGVCATISERANTRSLGLLGGLAPRMPKLAWLLTLGALALLSFPLMASFPALLMTFFGAFKTQPVGAFALVGALALVAVALAALLQRVMFGAPNPDAPGVSDSSLGESWYLALLAGALLWVGIVPGGPKIPGTDQPLFDPGLVNVMTTGVSDLSAPYIPQPTPSPTAPVTPVAPAGPTAPATP